MPLAALDAHPDNPRIEQRRDVVESLASRMRESGFDEAHALIVRPIGERFQIISGHHRAAAAAEAGLAEVSAWVRDMPDDEAFMALALCNTHGELTPIERGMHALKSGMSVRAYAEKVGRAHKTVDDEVRAARVMSACAHVRTNVPHRVLCEIHAAPTWLWPALVTTAERAGADSLARLHPFSWLSDCCAVRPHHWVGQLRCSKVANADAPYKAGRLG